MKYTCPMHPEIKSEKPGNCPICGMKLVLESEVKNKTESDKGLGKLTWKNYFPLFIIISLILVTSLTISYPNFELKTIIQSFMVGFFIVFAGFKLIDLNGFAQGYSTYDLLAKKWNGYGFVYPFIELFFGLSMIIFLNSREQGESIFGFYETQILWSEVIVMSFSGLGVLLKLAKGEKFQCVCLGTFLKIPLTKVTLIEDFGMALLALLLLTVI